MIKKFTLIDDDEIFVLLTSKFIEGTGLVEHIQTFDNGLDAIEFFSKNWQTASEIPEIMLVDLSMPILDGWQFIEEFAAIKKNINKRIDIYVCTSSISPNDVERAKNISDIVDFLIKPISKEKLAEIATVYLENKTV
jgi:CheY-like chemotaxis protein